MPSVGKVTNDWIPGRFTHISYGLVQNEPLSFSFSFGLNPIEVDHGRALDRWDVQKITGWLTGHKTDKWLHFDQADLAGIRYKCRFTSLTPLEVNGEVYAFSATVTCDSAFAYMLPKTFTLAVTDAGSGIIHSESSMNDIYYPKIEIDMAGGGDLAISNTSNTTTLEFEGLPTGSYTIYVNGYNGVITSSNSLNIYQYLDGYSFLGLSRGDNVLSVTASAADEKTVRVVCEFPVNVGA